MKTKITEEEARAMNICPACKKEKMKGLVVCWDCFKHRKNPFKYSNLELSEWLKELNKTKI